MQETNFANTPKSSAIEGDKCCMLWIAFLQSVCKMSSTSTRHALDNFAEHHSGAGSNLKITCIQGVRLSTKPPVLRNVKLFAKVAPFKMTTV